MWSLTGENFEVFDRWLEHVCGPTSFTCFPWFVDLVGYNNGGLFLGFWRLNLGVWFSFILWVLERRQQACENINLSLGIVGDRRRWVPAQPLPWKLRRLKNQFFAGNSSEKLEVCALLLCWMLGFCVVVLLFLCLVKAFISNSCIENVESENFLSMFCQWWIVLIILGCYV